MGQVDNVLMENNPGQTYEVPVRIVRTTSEIKLKIVERITKRNPGRESHMDRIVFLYNWGCNYQSAIAAMVTDIIRERTGLPTACIGLGELTRLETLEQSQNRIDAFLEMLR